jgi:NAD(P)-dependent dehydrogenase (short-subunit alcohol dehydrogenase family)
LNDVQSIKCCVDEFGHIDYVFANAAAPGFSQPEFGKLEKPNTSETLDTLNSVLYTIHAATPFLVKSPASDRAILITGSDAAFQGFDFNPSYGMAKAAMNGLTFSYADLLLNHGIRINSKLAYDIESQYNHLTTHAQSGVAGVGTHGFDGSLA